MALWDQSSNSTVAQAQAACPDLHYSHLQGSCSVVTSYHTGHYPSLGYCVLAASSKGSMIVHVLVSWSMSYKLWLGL